MDILQQDVEVVVNTSADITASTDISIDTVDTKKLDISFDDNEYSIVGDDMVIVTKYEDAPQWLKDTIDNVVNIKTAVAVGDLNATKEALDIMLNELNVAKNTYQLSIVSSADIDSRITTAITSLNSALRDADATILEVANTAVTPSEASAIALNTLSASLSSNGEIGSALHNLQTAMTTLENTTASDISYLESTMEGEIVGNANAMQTIRTYVGIDEAGASTGTGLSAYLEGNDGNFGSAGSQLNNDIKVTAEGVESKWAYNSTVNINGVYKKSGFGLTTNYASGSGTEVDPYVSEFWIDASRLKFTNSNKTGGTAPFIIDATGVQPQVTFNGKVTFGSGQTGTIDEAIAAVVETVAVGDKNINITDNLIPITSLVADTDNSGYQFISTPTKSNTAGIDTYAEAQIVLDGSDEVYSPYVDDMTISYYYRFGIKGITSGSVFKIVTINSSNVATSNTVTITMNSGQSIVATNWYIIEGIINPIGGSSAAVGNIRNSNGVKIGTVSSFVMPSGTSKLVLGWVASCTISRAKLCKVTADTVTSDLTMVNGQLSTLQTNIDNISWSSLQGKDLMAQQLGYTNYSELVSAASTGTTLINGGYINTGLIQTSAITADMINTNGLIAENISADEIVGKTLTGAVINGARINGAVVKASYLDLDGQLQVLTNYRISTAMYNANPSLYSDAVYISADGEYRIPSISTVKENDSSLTTKNNTIYGSIRSYNTANAGNNNKAVKIRPYFIISKDVMLFSCIGTLGDGYYANKGCNISLGSISLLMIMFNANSLILTVNGTSYSLDSTTNGHSKSVTITIYGFVFQVNAGESHSGGLFAFASSSVNVTLKQNSGFFLGTDFNSTSNGFKIQDTTSHAGDTSVNCSLSSAISVNNMI